MSDGHSALHLAAKRGNTELIRALVERGADTRLSHSKAVGTALDAARSAQQADAARLLAALSMNS